MKAIKRYICVLFTIFIVYIVYRSLLLLLIKNDPNGYFNIWFRDHCSTTILSNDLQKNFTLPSISSLSSKKNYYQMEKFFMAKKHSMTNDDNDDDDDDDDHKTGLNCRMDSDCFDFNRCPHGDDIRIYIYPYDSEHTSVLFRKIVTFIKQSKYYESDPNKACLFISNMDTLDRDRRSYNFHKYSIESSIDKLLLHEGRNHLMFNLYSGSWPDYVGMIVY